MPYESPRDERFAERVNDYATFVRDHDKGPSMYSADAHERSLHWWIVATRRRAATLPEHRQALLDDLIPGWRKRNHLAPFADRARAYAAFTDENGRPPSLYSDDHAERSLYRWLTTVRERSATLPAHERALLDDLIPEWRTSRKTDTHFENRAREYARFVATHGRKPNRDSNDDSERSLMRWIDTVRSRQSNLTPHRLDVLHTLIPDWNEPEKRKTFGETAEQYHRFVAEHDRDPMTTATDDTERSLANWRTTARRYTRSASESALLDRIDADRHARAVSALEDCAREYLAFVMQHGRRPSYYRKGADARERTMDIWLKNLRSGRISLSDEQRAALDRIIPWWNGDLADAAAWAERVRSEGSGPEQ